MLRTAGVRTIGGVVVILGLAGSALPAFAHHSFAMFDTTKRVTLAGTVTAFEWTNPHAYIELDVADERGAVKHWSIELGSPSILMQGGWKFKDLEVRRQGHRRRQPAQERPVGRAAVEHHDARRPCARQRALPPGGRQ